MVATKSPRQYAIEHGEATYISVKHPCKRCGGRKRFTNNGACKKCQALRVKAIRARAKVRKALLAEANRERDLHPPPPAVCPGCGRPWSKPGEMTT